MAKLGSQKRPAIVRMSTMERASEIVRLCDERGWAVIAGVEEDKEEDLSDVERLLRGEAEVDEKPRQCGPKIGRNDPCPCGSGKKFKKCCLLATPAAASLPGG